MFEQVCLVDRAVRTVLQVTVDQGSRRPWLAPGAPPQQQEFALRLWLVDRQDRPFRRTVRVRRTGGGGALAVAGWRWAQTPGGAAVVVGLAPGGGAYPRLQVHEGGRFLRLGGAEVPELVGEVQAQVLRCQGEALSGLALLTGQVEVEGYVRQGTGPLRRLAQSREFQATLAMPGLQPGDELVVQGGIAAVQRGGQPAQQVVTARVGGWALRSVLVAGEGGLWLQRQVVGPVAVEAQVEVELGLFDPGVTWLEGDAELPQAAERLLFGRAQVDRRTRVLVELVVGCARGTAYHCLQLPVAGLRGVQRLVALELQLLPGGRTVHVSLAAVVG